MIIQIAISELLRANVMPQTYLDLDAEKQKLVGVAVIKRRGDAQSLTIADRLLSGNPVDSIEVVNDLV